MIVKRKNPSHIIRFYIAVFLSHCFPNLHGIRKAVAIRTTIEIAQGRSRLSPIA